MDNKEALKELRNKVNHILSEIQQITAQIEDRLGRCLEEKQESILIDLLKELSQIAEIYESKIYQVVVKISREIDKQI